MASVTEQSKDLDRLDRYRRYVVIAIVTLLAFGMGALLFVIFGRGILPPAIAIEPERLRPFDGPVCPGEVAEATTITYVINRPSVLIIDAVMYDIEEQRAIPTTAIDTTARPSPYVLSESRPITFTAPVMPPGRYEWQLAITTRGENSLTAFWFIEFEIDKNCEPIEQPTTEPAP